MSNFYWSPGLTIKSMEESFVADALHFYQGSQQSAANSLGITLEQLDIIIKRSTLNAEEQKKQDEERSRKSAEFLARSRGVVAFDQATGANTISPYVSTEGLGSLEAANVLAQVSGAVTPENVIPTVSVLATAGDPVAAAKRTKALMNESVTKDQNFPGE